VECDDQSTDQNFYQRLFVVSRLGVSSSYLLLNFFNLDVFLKGESNVKYNPDWYVCHFKNLTYDWAYTFFDGTVETHEEGWSFPVGFVQVRRRWRRVCF
jgi:hypothetical protein